MFKLKWILISILTLITSQYVSAGVEVSIQGGTHINNDIQLKDTVGSHWEDPKRNAWILGGDILYRIPVVNIGGGMRYQRSCLKDPSTSEDTTQTSQEPSGFCADRLALLGSYRLSLANFFIGPLVTLDIFKTLRFEQDGVQDAESMNVKSRGWTTGIGQLGIEAGVKISNFFIKAELGYSFLSFTELECSNDSDCFPDVDPEDREVNLSAPYVLVGIGLSFL